MPNPEGKELLAYKIAHEALGLIIERALETGIGTNRVWRVLIPLMQRKLDDSDAEDREKELTRSSR